MNQRIKNVLNAEIAAVVIATAAVYLTGALVTVTAFGALWYAMYSNIALRRALADTQRRLRVLESEPLRTFNRPAVRYVPASDTTPVINDQ